LRIVDIAVWFHDCAAKILIAKRLPFCGIRWQNSRWSWSKCRGVGDSDVLGGVAGAFRPQAIDARLSAVISRRVSYGPEVPGLF
jgi:hypothetical protein